MPHVPKVRKSFFLCGQLLGSTLQPLSRCSLSIDSAAMLRAASPRLVCSVSGSLCVWVLSPLSPHSRTPLPGNTTLRSVSVTLVGLVCFRFHIQVKSRGVCLSWTCYTERNSLEVRPWCWRCQGLTLLRLKSVPLCACRVGQSGSAGGGESGAVMNEQQHRSKLCVSVLTAASPLLPHPMYTPPPLSSLHWRAPGAPRSRQLDAAATLGIHVFAFWF